MYMSIFVSRLLLDKMVLNNIIFQLFITLMSYELPLNSIAKNKIK